MNTKHAARFALVVGSITLAVVAQAQMIGNMPELNDIALTADIDNARHKALGFTMGGNAYLLKSVDVRVGGYNIPGSLVLEIWSNSSINTPDQPLHQMFAPPPGGTAIQTYTFFVNGSFFFAPGATYWLRMSGLAGMGPDWRGSSPGITPTGFGATHFGSLFTTSGGTSWTNSSTLNSYKMNCNIVPEPASFVAVGLGLALLVSRRRKARA